MKKILIFVPCFALCLMFVSCMDSTYDSSNTESTDESTESVTEKSSADTSTTAETTDDDIAYGVDVDTSHFPFAWRSLNATVVTWGDQNENGSDGYVCFDVEFEEIFSETMSESEEGDYYGNEYSYEGLLLNQGFILIPEEYADDIVKGETALIFTGSHAVYTITNDEGERVDAFKIVATCPIIKIYDNKLVLPDNFSETLTYYLTEGNTFMERNYPDVDIRFEDGMTVEEFGEFVEYLCTEADGLIYP
ncbi:MAG: hypothetical protein LUD43_03320 [Firmicutes bacterium]|nr:hypothetical protein [Bacillota bacterium]